MKIFILTLLGLALLSSMCEAQDVFAGYGIKGKPLKIDTVLRYESGIRLDKQHHHLIHRYNTMFLIKDSTYRHHQWFYSCVDLKNGRHAWLLKGEKR